MLKTCGFVDDSKPKFPSTDQTLVFFREKRRKKQASTPKNSNPKDPKESNNRPSLLEKILTSFSILLLNDLEASFQIKNVFAIWLKDEGLLKLGHSPIFLPYDSVKVLGISIEVDL